MNNRYAVGIATTEYLVVLLCLFLALLLPVADGKNCIELLCDALISLYASWSYLISTATF
jgi:hypothetical protein